MLTSCLYCNGNIFDVILNVFKCVNNVTAKMVKWHFYEGSKLF